MANWPLIFLGSAVGLTIAAGVKQVLSASPMSGGSGGPSLPRLKNWGVPSASPTGRVWPVQGGDKSVPYTTPDGRVVGNGATRFGASRESGGRIHAGIDLQAAPGQKILAMEDGIVVGEIDGYVKLDAVVIQHPSVVANYAEVQLGSLTKAGLKPGDRVKAGQAIAFGALNYDSNSMLHLELWQLGHAPKYFNPWYPGKIPPGLLDPTAYLLNLARIRG